MKGLGTKLLNLQSHDFAVFFTKLNYMDIIPGRKPFREIYNPLLIPILNERHPAYELTIWDIIQDTTFTADVFPMVGAGTHV